MTCELNSTSSAAIFAGNSKMALLMRSFDWSQTLLGPLPEWSQSFKATVNILINSYSPMFIWWGRECVNLYNDAACFMLGASQHPHCLGQPAKTCWTDAWDVIGPLVDSIFETGQPTCAKNLPVMVERNGYIEELYFTFSYSPICDEKGGISGIFCTVNETTQQVIGERWLQTLRALTNTVSAQTVEEACHLAIRSLERNHYDLPFALLYRVEADPNQARLVSTTSNIEASAIACLQQVDLTKQTDPWNLARVHQTRKPERVGDLATRLGELPGGAWPEPAQTALVLPLSCHETQPLIGFLVVGVSPRQVLDDAYHGFIELAASHVEAAIANTQLAHQERKYSEIAVDCDLVQKTCLSNEHQQFRTSLSKDSESDRHRIEVELQQSQSLLQNIIDNATILVYLRSCSILNKPILSEV